MTIVRATSEDLPRIRALLASANLVADDLTEDALRYFFALVENGKLIGAVGLEPYGQVGLLRSLVVAGDAQQHGFGGALLLAAETLASDLGISAIYLLTNSAQAFFGARGYRVVARADAPSSIQHTTQFSALCPSTAFLMVKP